MFHQRAPIGKRDGSRRKLACFVLGKAQAVRDVVHALVVFDPSRPGVEHLRRCMPLHDVRGDDRVATLALVIVDALAVAEEAMQGARRHERALVAIARKHKLLDVPEPRWRLSLDVDPVARIEPRGSVGVEESLHPVRHLARARVLLAGERGQPGDVDALDVHDAPLVPVGHQHHGKRQVDDPDVHKHPPLHLPPLS